MLEVSARRRASAGFRLGSVARAAFLRTIVGDLPSSLVAEFTFVGRTGGPVKALRGFRKTHHSVPDAVNPATLGFLARLCTDELAEEAEAFFQAARQALAYKRKDIALAVTSPSAVLSARDFTLEIFGGAFKALGIWKLGQVAMLKRYPLHLR